MKYWILFVLFLIPLSSFSQCDTVILQDRIYNLNIELNLKIDTISFLEIQLEDLETKRNNLVTENNNKNKRIDSLIIRIGKLNDTIKKTIEKLKILKPKLDAVNAILKQLIEVSHEQHEIIVIQDITLVALDSIKNMNKEKYRIALKEATKFDIERNLHKFEIFGKKKKENEEIPFKIDNYYYYYKFKEGIYAKIKLPKPKILSNLEKEYKAPLKEQNDIIERNINTLFKKEKNIKILLKELEKIFKKHKKGLLNRSTSEDKTIIENLENLLEDCNYPEKKIKTHKHFDSLHLKYLRRFKDTTTIDTSKSTSYNEKNVNIEYEIKYKDKKTGEFKIIPKNNDVIQVPIGENKKIPLHGFIDSKYIIEGSRIFQIILKESEYTGFMKNGVLEPRLYKKIIMFKKPKWLIFKKILHISKKNLEKVIKFLRQNNQNETVMLFINKENLFIYSL